jgi:SecD/SecF fusion protein
MSRQIVWRAVIVLAVIAASLALVSTRPVRLGLDLRGGTQIVLEARPTQGRPITDDTMTRTLEVLRRRVDQLGVTEPTLQRSGNDRIIVELPGVTDPEEALEVVGRTAQLTFHRVRGVAEDDATPPPGGALVLPDELGTPLRLGEGALTGDAVGDAEAVLDPQLGAAWQVTISLRADGGDAWARITGRAACEPLGSPQRRVAIVLDNEIISSPEVSAEVVCDEGITGGETVITGDFTEDEAKELALLIRAGALPVPVEVVEQRTVGPTLGEAAIAASVRAALIGGALTIAYVVVYYRLLGALAALALLVYGLLAYAALLGLGATLTLPGIAGFVLAIGMAVDANVLVFERSKEEFAAGTRLRSALLDGFKKAWSAIADSNATTLIAAAVLFYFAAGAVRGFGVTLTIGVLVSMFTALVVTRLFVETVTRARALVRRPGLFGMGVGGRLRARLDSRPIDLMGRAKWWFALSGVVAALALLGLFGKGLRFGLDFTGGRLIEYDTARPVDLDALRAELAEAGLPRAIVQRSGDGAVSVRTGRISASQEDDIAGAVERLGGSATELRDEFVGPSIGDELRRRAAIALALGLGLQLAYLAVRFRWTFGASAVVALFHDVVILLGLFAWLGKEVDGVFVAALLTVVGYSINDSVVVFDRIREQRRLRPREPFAAVANDACLHTIPRTINTGLGALFILVALYLLGGETLTDFALTLIVGIAVGTYSSVFTAAPLAVALEKVSPAPLPAATARDRALDEARARRAQVSDSSAERPAPARPAAPPRARAGSAKRKRRKRS